MELELGLAISNSPPKIPNLKELDLISYVNCKGNQVYEDENSSTLSCQSSVNDVDYVDEEINCGGSQIKDDKMKKRGFDEVNEVEVLFILCLKLYLFCFGTSTLMRMINCLKGYATLLLNEDDGVVGWPPIKSYRKKLNDAYHQQHRHGRNFPAMENGGRGGCCGGLRSMFVKVQIEGFFITRKIDLKLYHSYEALISSLLTMFGKEQDTMHDYELTYQDGDGDWLLAGDVPWSAFVESVQRLKLRRKDD
ncbi:Auxin-responsive protein IAA13 [Bienertia sinuspersici]